MNIDIPAGIRTLDEARQTPVQARTTEEELGRTAFLELMIAQINNQDPLEPAKNEAFIAQLAQFSSVEGIQNLNESMDSLVTSLRSSMTTDAANLVGRNVLIATNQTSLNNAGGIGGTLGVPAPGGEVQVEIFNSQGQRMQRLELGAQPAGDIRFDWNGVTELGEAAPQDFYRVRAFADVNGIAEELTVNLPDQVVSVSIESGGLILNLAGGNAVPASLIREIQ